MKLIIVHNPFVCWVCGYWMYDLSVDKMLMEDIYRYKPTCPLFVNMGSGVKERRNFIHFSPYHTPYFNRISFLV